MPDDLNIDAGLEPAAPKPRRNNYDDLIEKHARRTGLDSELVRAVVGQESGGNPRAVSPKGAQGIGQLMPATARRFGVRNTYDPDENLRGATDYLKFLNNRYKGNRDLVLAGYNAGEGAVDKFHGVPPYRETRNYVKQISQRLGAQKPADPLNLDSGLDLDAGLEPQRRAAPVKPQQSIPIPKPRPQAAQPAPQPSPASMRNPTNLIDKRIPNMVEALTGRPEFTPPPEPRSMSARQPSRWEKFKETVAPYVPGLATLDTPMGVKTDPLRGAASGLTLGAVGEPRQVSAEEKLLDPEAQSKADTAHTVGSFAPALVPYLAAEKALGAIPLLAQEGRVANIARTALSFGGVEAGREAIRAAKTDTPLDAKEIAISTAIGAAMGGLSGVNPSLKRRIVAYITPQAVADVARGTDPSTAAWNAFINLGFAVHSGIASRTPRNLEAKLTAAEHRQPVAGITSPTDGGLHTLSRGEIADLRARGYTDETIRPLTREDATRILYDTPSTPQPNVETQPEAFKSGETSVGAEPSSVGVRAEKPATSVLSADDSARPHRWQHTDFGEVTESPRQNRVGKGRVRVTDAQGVDHVIKRAALTGAGNQRAIPLKETTEQRSFDDTPMSPDELARAEAELNLSAGVEPGRAQVDILGETNDQAATEPQLQPSSREGLPPVDRGVTAPPPPPVAETPPAVAGEPVAPPPPSTTSARKAQMGVDRAESDAPRLPATTSVKNEATAELRRELDLVELEGPERKSFQQTIDNATRRGLDQEAESIAKDVVEGKRTLSDEDEAGLQLRMRQLENQWEEVYRADPKSPELDDIKSRLNNLTRASKQGGTPLARAMAFRNSFIDKDYKLISMVRRAEEAKGRTLSAEEFKRYEKMSDEIVDLKTKLQETDDKVAEQSLQKQIERVKRRGVRVEKRATLDEEFAQLTQEFRAKMTGVHPVGIDPTLVPILAKMAKNRVHAGITDVAQLVDSVHAAISDHVDIDRRELRDLISGYGLTKELSKEQVDRNLRELKSTMRLMSAIEDAEARQKPLRSGLQRDVDTLEIKELRKQLNDKLREVGLSGPLPGPRLSEGVGRTEGPRQSEARKLPMEGPRKSEARQSGIPLQGPKLSDINKLPAAGPRLSEGTGRKQGPRITDAPFVGPRQSDVRRVPMQGPRLTDAPKVGPKETLDALKKRVGDQINEYQRRLTERDFSERPKRQPVIDTRETRALKDRLAKVKSEYERELERDKGLFWQNLSGMRKSWMLSGLKTQARNIGGTAGYQVFDEVARMPAVIADAAMTPITGQRSIAASNPITMLDSVLKGAKSGFGEAREIVKLGATREQLERQQLREINTGVKAVDLAHNVVFRFMSASDRVFYNIAKERALLDRATVAAKNEGASNVRQRARELMSNEQIVKAAEHDALVNTFNNDNRLSSQIKKARSGLKPVENFAIDLILPFDRTPTNVVMRVLEAAPVTGQAITAVRGARVAKALVDKSLTVEQQRQFAQAFGRSTVGTALVGLGWAMTPSGVITTDDYGNAYLNVRGHKINLTSISPVGNLIAMGANMYKAAHKDKGKLRAGVGAVAKPLADIPLLRSTSEVSDLIKDPERSAAKTGGRLAASFIPFSGALRDTASLLDPEEKRSPKGFIDQIKVGIPGLRQQVGVSTSPLFAGKTASTPAIKEAQRLGMRLVGVQISPKETAAEFEKRRAATAPVMQRELDTLVASPAYNTLSDTDKRAAIKDMMEAVRNSYERQEGGRQRKPREQRKPRTEYQFQ